MLFMVKTANSDMLLAKSVAFPLQKKLNKQGFWMLLDSLVSPGTIACKSHEPHVNMTPHSHVIQYQTHINSQYFENP